jgi:MFS family permease
MHDAYAALRYPAFRYFIGAQVSFTLAILVQEIVLAYYLYEMTGDPLALGLIGLAEAIPFISLALFGGYLADKWDRKIIYLSSFAVVALVTLALIAFLSDASPWKVSVGMQPLVIYGCVFIFGVARGFYNPSWNSLKPFLVRQEHYSNSASWSAQFWQVGRIGGPILGGFLYAYVGLMDSLWVVMVLLLLTILSAYQIPSQLVANKNTSGLKDSLREGFQFVRSQKILWYSIVLDMFSVFFGGVIALLPVFAKDILSVGSEGLGFLRAAPGVGAALTMIGTAYFPPTVRAWRNMLMAVAGFGFATIAFALSTNFYFSLLALFLTGAFDSISVVVRSTILQLLPPENMRGRISSVSSVFVSTSNELGAFESGAAARIMGVVPSVVFGGVSTLGVVTYIYSKSRELFKIRLYK